MGIFDKNSSSESTTTASQTTPTSSGDNSSALGFGNITTGKKSSVNLSLVMTDQGAVNAGRDLGLAAIEANSNITGKVIDSNALTTGKAFDVASAALTAADRSNENTLLFSQSTIKSVLDSSADQFKFSGQQIQQGLDRALTAADNITRSDSALAINNLMKYGAIAAVLIVGLFVWGKK